MRISIPVMNQPSPSCDSRWRKQHMFFRQVRTWVATFFLLPRLLLHGRTSWPNDSTISWLASGCSLCTQAGSAIRKLLWRCTGSGGRTPNRMRWKRAARSLSLVQMGELSSAARHWMVFLLRQALSKLSVPSVTLSGGRHVPGVLLLVTHWSISRRFLSNWRSSSLVNLRTSRRGAAAGPSGMTSDHLRPLLGQVRVS